VLTIVLSPLTLTLLKLILTLNRDWSDQTRKINDVQIVKSPNPIPNPSKANTNLE
jgi:hypothetical protein